MGKKTAGTGYGNRLHRAIGIASARINERAAVGPHFQGGHPQFGCVEYEPRRDSATVRKTDLRQRNAADFHESGNCDDHQGQRDQHLQPGFPVATDGLERGAASDQRGRDEEDTEGK